MKDVATMARNKNAARDFDQLNKLGFELLDLNRVNDAISYLFDPTHPAVIRLIKMVVDAARSAGIWVGVCGEMAGDVTLTPLLVGLGVDELSASSRLVPRVKKAVQSLNLSVCQSLAEEAFHLDTGAEIMARCEQVARAHYGDIMD